MAFKMKMKSPMKACWKSHVQKGKMMDNLSKLQMMNSKEKKGFKKLEGNS